MAKMPGFDQCPTLLSSMNSDSIRFLCFLFEYILPKIWINLYFSVIINNNFKYYVLRNVLHTIRLSINV